MWQSLLIRETKVRFLVDALRGLRSTYSCPSYIPHMGQSSCPITLVLCSRRAGFEAVRSLYNLSEVESKSSSEGSLLPWVATWNCPRAPYR
jgi:hypothetical protein